MTTSIRILIVIVMAAAVILFKAGANNSEHAATTAPELNVTAEDVPGETASLDNAVEPAAPAAKKAKLMCFGAEQCVPCRMMVPVREPLSETYPDTLNIEFIDVWKDRSAGAQKNIRVIPTAIFFDFTGAEVYRQEGLMDKETIVAKFQEHGVALDGKSDS